MNREKDLIGTVRDFERDIALSSLYTPDPLCSA